MLTATPGVHWKVTVVPPSEVLSTLVDNADWVP